MSLHVVPLTSRRLFEAQFYNLLTGLKSAFNHDSHPYNKDDMRHASNTRFFTKNCISLFFFINKMNLLTSFIFLSACVLTAEKTDPSHVKVIPGTWDHLNVEKEEEEKEDK